MTFLFDFSRSLVQHKSTDLLPVLVDYLLPQGKSLEGLVPAELTALIEQLKSLEAALDDSAFLEHIRQQGFSAQSVQAFISLLRQLDVNLSGNTLKVIESLTQPTSAFVDGVDWPLINSVPDSSSTLWGKVAVAGNFSINAAFKSQFLASATALEGKLEDNSDLMGYSLLGDIGVGVDLSLNASRGALSLSVAAGTSASADANIHLYLKTSPEQMLLKTLYDHLRVFDDISDLTAFVNGDVKALTVSYNGGLKAHAQVGMGYMWTVNQDNPAAQSGQDMSVKLGAEFGTQWQLSGSFTLTSYLNAERNLVVEINKSKVKTHARQLSVSATVATPGIKDKAKAYVATLTEFDEKLQQFLDEFAAPKAKLQSTLKDVISSRPEWQQDLVLLSTGEDTSSALLDALTDKIARSLDQPFVRFEKWVDDHQQIRLLATEAARAVGLGELADSVEAMAGVVESTAQQWQQDFKASVTSLASEQATRVLAPLKQYGLQVDDLLNNLDNLTDELLAPIYKFRAQYAARLQQITDFINTTMVEEVGIAYQRIASSASDDQALLNVTFNIQSQPQLEKVAQLYATCMSGDIAELLAIFRAQQHDGLFTLNECQLKTLVNTKLSSSFSINLFGLTATSRTIMEENTLLVRDGHGQLSAFESDARFKKENESGNEFNKLSIGNMFNHLVASESNVSVNLVYGDADLTKQELVGFLSIFEHMHLVSQGMADKSFRVLHDEQLIDSVVEQRVLVQLSLPLEKTQLATAYALTPDSVFKSTVFNYVDAYTCYVASEGGYLKDVLEVVAACLPEMPLDKVVYTMLTDGYSRKARIRKVLSHMGYTQRQQKRVERQTLKFLDHVDDAADAMVDYLSLIKDMCEFDVPSSLDEQQAQDLKQQKATQLRAINQQLDEMVRGTSNTFEINMDRVHPRTVGFIKTLTDLAGVEQSSLIPMIYKQTDTGLPEPIVVI